MRFAEHKHAVESIKRACDEGPKLTLIVGHPTNYSESAPILPMPSSTLNKSNGHQSPSHEEHGESSG